MRGFRGYRRNEKSPLRALTQALLTSAWDIFLLGRNEKSPLRALTHNVAPTDFMFSAISRNEESPFRALTQNGGNYTI